MKHITFYLDFISPYAYLAFEKLPETLMGLSYSVTYKPVLLGAMLNHHGQLGPAEIAAKRSWTYRHVLWLGHHNQVPLQMPSAHPFNPLALLRLALAHAKAGAPNRFICESIFRHVWRGGEDAINPERLEHLSAQLAPQLATDADTAKQLLKLNTDEAIKLGVFGVPAFAVDDKLFWGFDALPMLRAYLEGNPWFDSSAWLEPDKVSVGITRKP